MYVGNIGQGKSLISSKLAKQGKVIVNMDSILLMVHGGEYGLFDPDKKQIYRDAEEAVIKSSLAKGFDVVVDRTNMRKDRRQKFIELAKNYTEEIECYHFGRGDKELCLKNRMKNPRGVPRKTWEMVYRKMAESYEEPEEEEGFSRIIEMPKLFTSHLFPFIGRVVTSNEPEFGEADSDTVEIMKKLWQELSNIVIVKTDGKIGTNYQARDFLIKNKIPFDSIDHNPVQYSAGNVIRADHYY
jgi:predicted kinase